MQLKTHLKAQMPFLALTTIVFVLSSCGSYQYAGDDNDGIYGASEEPVEQQVGEVQNNSNSYYKNYFKEKSTEYDYITQESEIFTDIDSYEGQYVEQDTVEQESYAGWGQENNDVTINVYGGGFAYNNWMYRPYRIGWGYSPFWNTGWGYGFYDPFWGSPYYGYGNYYGYGGFYGYGGYYGYPYHNGYYNNPYYGRNRVAYHNSRRGTSLGRMNTLGRRSNTNLITRGNSSSTRPNIQPRRGNSNVTTQQPRPRTNNSETSKPKVKPRSNTTSTPRPRTNTSTPRPRVNTSTPRPRTNTTKPRTVRSNTSSRPSSTPRASSSSRRGRR
ncbi:hypothetical protein ACFS5M_05960 [Lacinutrix iliipiscaria]|uniref:Vitellogenin II n=1 Tax=Lacinutrix iliipiscaria TaxID=1230532 RepID=A0ABW5WMV4_9FLAO